MMLVMMQTPTPAAPAPASTSAEPSQLNSSSQNPSSTNPSSADLYTIPICSSWFSWDEIHEKEKTAHKDFFNNTCFSKTPKIYKEYRDFIINKYREDPGRRLTFSDVRKSLVGDVSSLLNIFNFLDAWGLINFAAPPPPTTLAPTPTPTPTPPHVNHPRPPDAPPPPRLVVEEGAPAGIRVAEYPNSTKALALAPVDVPAEEGADGGRFWLPPLASYSDVFREIGPRSSCAKCGSDSVSVHGYYESQPEDGSVICEKCFKSENHEEGKLADEHKFVNVGAVSAETGVWTESETILLLEAVTKHGDDWNSVEKHVRTKTKPDCISRLIQLPFGDRMLRTSHVGSSDTNSASSVNNDKEHLVCNTNDAKEMEITSVAEPREPIKSEDQHLERTIERADALPVSDGDESGPPPKRRCITSFGDASDSLLHQVALLSKIVGPDVAAAAAEGAVAALCNENPCARKFYEAGEDNTTHDFAFPTSNNESAGKPEGQDTEMESKHIKSEAEENTPNVMGPSTLQVRVAIATAFGAAAAHAKLLADQEEREIEQLMATIIETQVKKLQYKIKHFEELELIMEKEYSHIQQLKEDILANRIDVLQRALNAGVTRWKDNSIKPLADLL